MQGFWQLAADQHTVLFARTFLALVLLTASGAKLGNLHEFVGVVRNYRLLPDFMVRFVARALPASEAIVAIGLLVGVLVDWLALAGVGLFLLFGGAVAVNLLRGRRDISCGCLGLQHDQRLSWSLVMRNATLAGLAGMLWVVPPIADRATQFPVAETVATMLLAGAAVASWWLWNVILKFWRFGELANHSSHNPPQRVLQSPSLAKAARRRRIQ